MYTYANDPDFDFCAKRSELEGDNCYGNKALEESIKVSENQNGDIEKIFTLCQKIINTDKRANCLDIYYYEKAQKEADLEMCKQMFNQQFKDTCVFRVIIDSKKQEGLCNNIRDDSKRESCFATLKASNN